jgi:hypothetical protein
MSSYNRRNINPAGLRFNVGPILSSDVGDPSLNPPMGTPYPFNPTPPPPYQNYTGPQSSAPAGYTPPAGSTGPTGPDTVFLAPNNPNYILSYNIIQIVITPFIVNLSDSSIRLFIQYIDDHNNVVTASNLPQELIIKDNFDGSTGQVVQSEFSRIINVIELQTYVATILGYQIHPFP